MIFSYPKDLSFIVLFLNVELEDKNDIKMSDAKISDKRT
jgi:hypothetical protein